MDQRIAPARDRRLFEPQIIPLERAETSPSAVLRRSVDAPAAQRHYGTRFKFFGILLLAAPAIIILSALILVSLLVIFVIWLVIVSAMAAAIVMSDLIGGLTGRLLHALRALDHRPIPAGQ